MTSRIEVMYRPLRNSSADIASILILRRIAIVTAFAANRPSQEHSPSRFRLQACLVALTDPIAAAPCHASTAWLIGPLLSMNSVLARVLIDDADAAHHRAGRRNSSMVATRRASVPSPFTTTCATRCVSASLRTSTRCRRPRCCPPGSATATPRRRSSSRCCAQPASKPGSSSSTSMPQCCGACSICGLRFVDHSYTEVLLDGAWVADRQLRRRQVAFPRGAGRPAHRRPAVLATVSEWTAVPSGTGARPRSRSSCPDDPGCSRHRWGVFPDVAAFYDSTPSALEPSQRRHACRLSTGCTDRKPDGRRATPTWAHGCDAQRKVKAARVTSRVNCK